MTLRLHLGDRRRDEASLSAYLLLADAKLPFERIDGDDPYLQADGQRISGLLAIADHFGLPSADRALVAQAEGFPAFRAAYPYALVPPLPRATPSAEAARELAAIDAIIAGRREPFSLGDFALAPLAVRIRAHGLTVSPRAMTWVDAILALPAMERWVRSAAD